MTPFWGNFDRLRCQARRPGGKASLVLRVSSGHGRLSGALVALLNASAFRNPWVIGSELAKGPFTGLTTETTPGAASRCNKAGSGPQLGWRSTEAAMYPSLQQQTMMGGPGGMPPPHGPYSGMGQGDYPPQLPPPGMYPPLPQAQPPIRLARFPGDALHTAPMAAPGTMPLPPGMAPPQRAGSAGRQPAYGPPAGPMQQPFPMQPPRRMMGPGGPLPPPLAMAMGGMAPAGYQPQYMPGPPPPILLPSMMQQPPSPMHAGARSGHATPKSLAGSGANTPMHPLQRSLSNGQLAPTPGYPGPPGMLLPQQMGFLHMPPPPGMAALVAPPPGVVLPDSLSPGSPTPLRAPHGGGSAPGSRVQSATVMGHAGASSYGGSLMEPLASQVPAPIRAGLPRSGSTGSLPGSLRSSVDLSNSPARRSGERTPVGYFGGGGAGSFAAGAGGGAAKAGSKAGSAGRRTAGSAGGAQAAQPELDEYDNIKVAVRVRPPNAQELARGDAQAVFVNPADHRQVQLTVPSAYSRNSQAVTRNFTFHACLHPASRQQDVLRLCGITQLLDAALDGYNCTVLAYGQTGSGKTYTMSGREEALLDEGYMGDSDDGVITRSLMYLFQALEQRAGGAGGDGCRYSLRVSMAEIYMEQVYDLIRFDKKQLQVRWDTGRGFYMPDLACKECGTLEEALQVLSLAVRHRRVGSHEMNMESSRSHSIFTVYVDCSPTRADDHEYGITRYGKVSFVDLAGSERLRDSKSAGETLKETTTINRSLFMLGKVIAALADGAQGARVPYRESKLTKLLMDSLGGSSLSLLIACCSPSAAHAEETLSTLSYAARAKNIRNQPAVQLDPDQAALSALKREVKLLRTENTYLREQLFQANLPRGQPAAGASASLPASTAASRLPSSHGQPGTLGGGQLPLPLAPFAVPGGGSAVVAGSRPESGTAAGAAAGAGLGPSPSPEDLMRRLLETQRMLVQFSRENDRLAGENGRLRNGRALVSNDYKGALDEVDWLRGKLESLESALLAGSCDSGLLAALDAAGTAGPEVLEVAKAAVVGAGGGSESQQPAAPGSAGGDGEQQQEGPPEGHVPNGGSMLGGSMEPLASQLAAAGQLAMAAADQAVTEAAAVAAALTLAVTMPRQQAGMMEAPTDLGPAGNDVVAAAPPAVGGQQPEFIVDSQGQQPAPVPSRRMAAPQGGEVPEGGELPVEGLLVAAGEISTTEATAAASSELDAATVTREASASELDASLMEPASGASDPRRAAPFGDPELDAPGVIATVTVAGPPSGKGAVPVPASVIVDACADVAGS